MTYIFKDHKPNVCLQHQCKLAFYVRNIRERCESMLKLGAWHDYILIILLSPTGVSLFIINI